MQPQTKGERTKRHLYRCAIELFKQNGYQNVSVDEIVKKAGTDILCPLRFQGGDHRADAAGIR